MQEAFGPWLEGVVLPGQVAVAELLGRITDAQCTPTEFLDAAISLSPEQARVLLVATLHRSMAYSVDIMPIEQARSLAADFIVAAGDDAQFFSTCEAVDEVSGIGGWTVMVTNHTFESVLFCTGSKASALVVVVDED
jgi:hypothetical protein